MIERCLAPDRGGRPIVSVALTVIAAAFVVAFMLVVLSRADEADWYRSVMMPDLPNISCCGPADAYFSDRGEIDAEGNFVAIITDTRPDDMLWGRRVHVPPGTRVIIPRRKIQWRFGNPTGHPIVFLGAGGTVYCFIPLGGV
jgi:hypothetical protein